MNGPEECPVDGCDYDPQGDIDSLRGHVSASGDHPPWGDLKGGLLPSEGDGSEEGDGGDHPEGAPSEGDEPGDDVETDDQPEDPEEAPQEGGPEGDGSEGMATPEEYERQHETPSEGDESGGDVETDDHPDEGGSEGGSTPLEGWAALPIDPRTFITIAAVCVVAWMLYRVASSDAEETVDTEATKVSSDTTTDADAAGAADVGGPGLVQG
ncbi:MAG: hypothetical protein ABEH78_07975 [Haloferacaceae archaeon]